MFVTLGELKSFSFLLQIDTVCSADLFYGLGAGKRKECYGNFPHSPASWFCLLNLFGLCFLESGVLKGLVPAPSSVACLFGSIIVNHLYES